ncbi:MAG: DUF1553 domain-containing protein [Planctomycetota bacterium]
MPPRSFGIVTVSLFIGVFALLVSKRVGAAPPADSIEFFESRIRPVLVGRCYECHSADAGEVGGELMLDSSGGMLTGGDSGPAIQPGDVDASMLVSAIRYESTEMPPDGKLPDSVIKDFEDWIAAGAVDPRDQVMPKRSEPTEIDLDQGRQYWAFQPLQSDAPDIGSTSDAADRVGDDSPKSLGTIDDYIGAELNQNGLVQNPVASPSTRLRRLAFDLTGLPPTAAMRSAWLSDPSGANWRRIVDKLLASPAFAEHWARHWMDVARYADSNGSDFNATFHEAWRYRDYLVRSFAADRPFDQMIRQQVAGDLLPSASDMERHDNIVAGTFLMLGTKMLSERDKPKLTMDVVDEQIDTVGRAFLGLTMGCARCHDHKFDPIPTEDYYALAGIFRSTQTLKGESQQYVSTWNRTKLPTTEARKREVQRHATAIADLEGSIKKTQAAIKRWQRKSSGKEVGIVLDDSKAERTGHWVASTYVKQYIGVGYIHDDNDAKGRASITFRTKLPASGTYTLRYSHSASPNRASNVPITIRSAGLDETRILNQRQKPTDRSWTTVGKFEFQAEQEVTVSLSNEGTDGYVIVDAIQFVPSEDLKLETSSSQADLEMANSESKLKSLESELKSLKANAPKPLPEAMTVAERPSSDVGDTKVHIRGEINNLGETVPRGFVQVCGGDDARIGPVAESGRRELANWLTDPDHPLVARVFVNRVWMHLIGEGIVPTVDNFGSQGQRPTHPELLDHLAISFIRDGWQLKPLVRRIVLSHTYQASSEYRQASATIDPANRWLWRANRKRIPAESVRDAMLVASGQLDRRPRYEPMDGYGVLVSKNNGGSSATTESIELPYRSIYLATIRGNVHSLMRALDVADPDLLVGRRPTTNVPGQALVLINSPEIDRWVSLTTDRLLDRADTLDGRLHWAYSQLLQRDPCDADKALAAQYFGDRRDDPGLWKDYVAAIMAGTEFRLLD